MQLTKAQGSVKDSNMYEGPAQNYNDDPDILPEPFDYMEEANRLRQEREERERQEREARELAHAQEQPPKKDGLTHAEEPKEEKKHWLEIPSKPVQEETVAEVSTSEKTEEMVFSTGSEYTDDTLEKGNGATFELHASAEPEKPQNPADEVADYVQAQADALKKARDELSSIHDFEKTDRRNDPELAVIELAEEVDVVGERISESWTTEMPKGPQEATVEEEPTQDVPESQPIEIPEVPHVEEQLTPKMSETIELSDSPDLAHEEEKIVEDDIAEQEPALPELSVEENSTEAMSDPADKYESQSTPEWVRTIKRHVDEKQAPELRKWQKDVLGVQYPDLLHEYEAILHDERAHNFEAKSDAPKGDEMPNIIENLPEFMRANPRETLPAPMDTSTMNYPYRSSLPTLRKQSIKDRAMSIISRVFSPSLGTVLVGGGIFGALLIAVFGF